jgi:hypothetical protein
MVDPGEMAMAADDSSVQPFCPSAPPESEGAVAFGVVGGSASTPRVGYIVRPQPVTAELLALAAPAAADAVFRFAAPCAASACQHFDGANCQLATRIVAMLQVVTETLPACVLRPICRWWKQEGVAACRRCPQVVTHVARPSQTLRSVAAAPLSANSESVNGPKHL